MKYTPTNWAEGQAPALDAENLNKIENGIKEASLGVDQLNEYKINTLRFPNYSDVVREVDVGWSSSGERPDGTKFSWTATKDCWIYIESMSAASVLMNKNPIVSVGSYGNINGSRFFPAQKGSVLTFSTSTNSASNINAIIYAMF